MKINFELLFFADIFQIGSANDDFME
jgi:hypothetical protein